MANRKDRRKAAKVASARIGLSPAPGRDDRASAFVKQALHEERAGKALDAVKLLRQALAINPQHIESLNYLGILAFRAGDWEAARDAFTQILETCPNDAMAHYRRALVLKEMRDTHEAVLSLQRAITLSPNLGEAYLALGFILHEQGFLDRAADALEQALSKDPGYVEAYVNLGNLRREQWRLDEAAALGQKAVELRSTSALGLRNLAITFAKQGDLAKATAALDRALQCDPDFRIAQSERLFYLNYEPNLSARSISDQHRVWGMAAQARAPSARPTYSNDPIPHRTLRIGYVSGDFHNHPVGYFVIGALEASDRALVENVCYSAGPVNDAMTDRLRGAANQWRSIAGASDDVVEHLIKGDLIDILVDLSGHTTNNRLPVFARRPTPVSAAWLGYVCTTGLPSMDYLITDIDTAPLGSDHLYVEKLIRLPHGRFCYSPPIYAPLPANPPSLDGTLFTFGCFNDVVKIGPGVVRLWSDLLRTLPDSRLLLKWPSYDDRGVRERLREAFASEGVAEERIGFRGYSPHAEMLAQYRDIDVALDPFPHCGGLTTCESLWMGVPVITLPGEQAASRQTLAFLNLLNLSEFVAQSSTGYVAIAKGLYEDRERLATLRNSLRSTMQGSPICDERAFATSLERAFRTMWKDWCAKAARSS